MVRLAGSVLILALGTLTPSSAAQTPSRPVHRRRAPAQDPEKEKLKQSLAEATSVIGTLDSRVLELMGTTAALRRQLETNTLSTARLQQSLDDANRTVASLQSRLQTAEERADKAEREKVQKPAAAPVRTPSAEDARLAAQLDDIQRRRDSTIASVLRRYRELANEYRSFGTALAAPNERELTPKGGPELSRIQNTIALVEEDLRQLNGLEAQAALVRKAKSKMP